VLPAACFAEVDGTFTNTERKVQRIRKAVEPPGAARADWEIVAELAGRLGQPMSYAGAEAIMAEIARGHAVLLRDQLPAVGARGDPLALHGHRPPGHALPAHGPVHLRLGVFSAVEYRPPAESPDAEYPLTLTTGRVLYQYHTGTMTMKTDGLNERARRALSRSPAMTRALSASRTATSCS